VGYDGANTLAVPICSLGAFADQPTCEANNGAWSAVRIVPQGSMSTVWG
jgi:hypothetical protein